VISNPELQLIVDHAVAQHSNNKQQLLPIILNVIAVYRNAVQVLSGLNSVIDFTRLTVSLPRFFSKTTLS
jgi:hypothetical protein